MSYHSQTTFQGASIFLRLVKKNGDITFRHFTITFPYTREKLQKKKVSQMIYSLSFIKWLCDCIINLQTSATDNIMTVHWKTVQTARLDKDTQHVEFLSTTKTCKIAKIFLKYHETYRTQLKLVFLAFKMHYVTVTFTQLLQFIYCF